MNRITDMTQLKNRLVEMITKGVEEDGCYRKMDPMDYYEITDIEPKDLYKVLKEGTVLTPHERSVIVTYASKCKSIAVKIPKDMFIERIMKEILVIKEIEVTDEIKLEAINFMEMNNIPFAYNNYIAYIRRVVEQILIEAKRD